MITFGLISACVLGLVSAACQDDLKGPWGQCKGGYTTYTVNYMMALKDPSQLDAIDMMCSPEGQAAFDCIVDLGSQCPPLMQDLGAQGASMDPATVKAMGGLAGFCRISAAAGGGGGGRVPGGDGGGSVPGGDGGGSVPEPEAQPCAEETKKCREIHVGYTDQEPAPGTTPFTNIQWELKTLCGHIKAQMECQEPILAKCPTLGATMVKSTKDAMDAERRSKSGDATTVPTYDMAMAFIKNKCPSMPTDFATSACVSENLDSDKFVNCVKNATASPMDPQSCDGFHAVEKCLMDTVGFNCKTNRALFALEGAKLFVADVPTKCEPKTQWSNDLSGTSAVRVSMATLLMVILIAFKLL